MTIEELSCLDREYENRFDKQYTICLNLYIITELWEQCRGSDKKRLYDAFGINENTFKNILSGCIQFKPLDVLRLPTAGIKESILEKLTFLNKKGFESEILYRDAKQYIMLTKYAVCRMELHLMDREKAKVEKELGEANRQIARYDQLVDENGGKWEYDEKRTDWNSRRLILQDFMKCYDDHARDEERLKDLILQSLQEDYRRMVSYHKPKNNYERVVYYIRHEEAVASDKNAENLMEYVDELDQYEMWALLNQLDKKKHYSTDKLQSILNALRGQAVAVETFLHMKELNRGRKREDGQSPAS